MKKIYMQPAMMLVKTEINTVLQTGSDPKKQGGTNEEGNNLSKRRGGIFGSDGSEASNSIW